MSQRVVVKELADDLLLRHINTRHRIGVENIMVEDDYPHGDTTWPDTQSAIEAAWGHIPPNELRAMCCENAARLFRHPLPEVVVPQG